MWLSRPHFRKVQQQHTLQGFDKKPSHVQVNAITASIKAGVNLNIASEAILLGANVIVPPASVPGAETGGQAQLGQQCVLQDCKVREEQCA